MSGIPAFNIPAFDSAAAKLRSRGHDVFSPAEIDGPVSREVLLKSENGDHADLPKDESWSYYLARDFRILADDGIEAIVTLPGWSSSRGACCEVALGNQLGIKIMTYEEATTDDHEHMRMDDDGAPPVPVPDLLLYDSEGKFIPYADNPERQRSVQGGVKDNRSKSRVDLIPGVALMAVGQVMAKGAEKYKPHNWRLGLSYSDTLGSALRHLFAFNEGEDLDPETGLSHVAHAACQVLFLLTYIATEGGTDDRFSSLDPEEAKA